MLLTEGFLGWFKVRDFIKTKVFTRFKGMGGWADGGMGKDGFSSLVKQNKKGKICAVFCFAGKRKIFFIYL